MTEVTRYLREAHIPYELKAHSPSRSAAETARILEIASSRVLKTILLDTRGGRALLVVPGSERLDMHLVRRAVSDPHARLAGEQELAKDLPSYDVGCIPPLGSLLSLRTIVDPTVMDQANVVFCPGRRNFSVFVRTNDLFRDENFLTAPLIARSSVEGLEGLDVGSSEEPVTVLMD